LDERFFGFHSKTVQDFGGGNIEAGVATHHGDVITITSSPKKSGVRWSNSHLVKAQIGVLN